MSDYPPAAMITRTPELERATADMRHSDVLAVDTESNSRHRYPEQLCLIQIATRRKIYLIDPISLNDISALHEVFNDNTIKKLFHTADSDLRTLDRHGGFRLNNVYDTKIAARFIGLTQFSLVAVIQEMLGLTIEKKAALQKADWGQRPLSGEAVDYAAGDVRYLIRLQEGLDQKLEALGRTAWVSEENARLEAVRYNPPDPETVYLSVKGAYTLNPRGLAVLKSLVSFREAEARRWNRPPFYVMPDSALISLAVNPVDDLAAVPGIGKHVLDRFGPALKQALRAGLSASPVILPSVNPPPRLNAQQLQRLNRLKEWRSSICTNLYLEPDLIWPTASLGRLALAPDTLQIELEMPAIRRWQRDNFGMTLQAVLDSEPPLNP
ncbi:MAG: HRDC domain-containing protein [Dehalogenimonas sp.]|uniref:HRDC domain-containing protein n=1 Tax=Candidatus Dehalogenimonas loeffleri TaxID=3127115 RepID=A0ABZ2J4V4_9CHLR|nr:HRDC domain-containing protein [Dehalogenimonas sp.]